MSRFLMIEALLFASTIGFVVLFNVIIVYGVLLKSIEKIIERLNRKKK